MEITPEIREMLNETRDNLSGYKRRHFMAQVVESMLNSSPMRAEKELGWNRRTIRKGMHELESGIRCVDYYAGRGRKRAEEHLPHLLDDIKAILDEQSQTDPTFKTTRLFTRLSVAEVRRQLIAQKGYKDDELPCEETIRVKIKELGYTLRRVQKSRPKKRFPKQMPSSSS